MRAKFPRRHSTIQSMIQADLFRLYRIEDNNRSINHIDSRFYIHTEASSLSIYRCPLSIYRCLLICYHLITFLSVSQIAVFLLVWFKTMV